MNFFATRAHPSYHLYLTWNRGSMPFLLYVPQSLFQRLRLSPTTPQICLCCCHFQWQQLLFHNLTPSSQTTSLLFPPSCIIDCVFFPIIVKQTYNRYYFRFCIHYGAVRKLVLLNTFASSTFHFS